MRAAVYASDQNCLSMMFSGEYRLGSGVVLGRLSTSPGLRNISTFRLSSKKRFLSLAHQSLKVLLSPKNTAF